MKDVTTTTSFLKIFIWTQWAIQSFGAPPSFVSHNSPCNESTPCDPNALLMCTGGKCECESPSNQIYNKEQRLCLSSVGGYCSLPEAGVKNPRLCIQNAQCISIFVNHSINYTECECMEGYIENSAGECVPGIGMPCTYSPKDCNPLGMVICKNERCACLDSLQIYDTEIRRCVSPAGTHCKYDTLQLGCVKNAICYPFYYWIPPRCVCKPGYVQTASRHCEPEFTGAIRKTEDL